ncbi:GDP-mannose transporter GONST2 isoform X1 [Cucumis melo]|uniref:GDP-mannose transporter GONST2 isoform X1 n=1 Tax=Cucumis melo TaxID=3656 RepID=A0A1S3C5I1_CUCME|nr:GDP-mannose transporter GONST2 isoform X1 [Cucumis melo]
MSSDFKLEIDGEEPLVSIRNGNVEQNERGGTVHRILSGIRNQGSKSISNFLTNAQRRALGDRFFRGNQTVKNNGLLDGDETREHGLGRKTGPLLSGTAYCISSCSMIILNKVVLSSYNFNAGISLMFYQNLISSIVIILLGLCRTVSIEKLNWKLIRLWIPVNLIFIGMLVSGMYSLKYINIAMVTILKNVTNILTAIGELYIFRKRQNQKVWTAMFLMIISAISGGVTDLTFDTLGYGWQITNCVLTASYSLTLRRIMDEAKKLTRSGSLNEASMVLLNNLLSLPFGVVLIILFGEWAYVMNADVIKLPMFWVVATASGLLGLAISFTSMWFLNQTGPTTYSFLLQTPDVKSLFSSLVGSLNKIPISIAGILLFKVPLSPSNLFSILFGLFAGVFFARAKMSSKPGT